jgi:hypothetical protein
VHNLVHKYCTGIDLEELHVPCLVSETTAMTGDCGRVFSCFIELLALIQGLSSFWMWHNYWRVGDTWKD